MTTSTTLALLDDWRSLRRLAPRGYCRRSAPTSSRRTAELPRRTILAGDAASVLRALPSACIDCVITSPPYYLLRNYAVDGQLGMELSVEGWVEHIVAVCDELARVLKSTGSLWLNLGDSYSRHRRYGALPKSLLLAPERVLLRLHELGWIVRNKVVWAKPNPMPASVRDRLSCSWEPLYLLVRHQHYVFDLDAIRQPHRTIRTPSRSTKPAKYGGLRPTWAGPLAGTNDGLERAQQEGRAGHPLGKNPGDVWSIATAGYRGAHFATFPPPLLDRPLRATCPERVCAGCGNPWQRSNGALIPGCGCGATWLPGLVLDPFMGAGTVAVAAEAHRRDWLGIELNPDYRRLAMDRIVSARTARAQQPRHPKEVMTSQQGGTT
jgi:DNA modification methylase